MVISSLDLLSLRQVIAECRFIIIQCGMELRQSVKLVFLVHFHLLHLATIVFGWLIIGGAIDIRGAVNVGTIGVSVGVINLFSHR